MLTAMLAYHLSVLAMIHTASDTGSSTTECCKIEQRWIWDFTVKAPQAYIIKTTVHCLCESVAT